MLWPASIKVKERARWLILIPRVYSSPTVAGLEVTRNTSYSDPPHRRSLPSECRTHGFKIRRLRGLLAERVGFEPTVEFLLHTLSKRAP